MNALSSLRRLAATSGIVIGIAALPLAAGMAQVSAAHADGTPSFPLYSANGSSVGLVEVESTGAGTELVVSVDNALPGATYTVSACEINFDTSTTCVGGGDMAGSITTDATGSASQTLSISNVDPGTIAIVKLVNSANSAETYLAATGPGASVPAAVFTFGS